MKKWISSFLLPWKRGDSWSALCCQDYCQVNTVLQEMLSVLEELLKLSAFISSISSPGTGECSVFPQLSSFSPSCKMSIFRSFTWGPSINKYWYSPFDLNTYEFVLEVATPEWMVPYWLDYRGLIYNRGRKRFIKTNKQRSENKTLTHAYRGSQSV